MTLVRLALTDFRNHAESVIDAGSGLIVLTGENGAGKTNILEAISLFAPGRGLRGAAFPEIARQGGNGGFAAAARLENSIEIGTGVTADALNRRQVRINGATASANAMAEYLSLLWLTPAMDRLFLESPGGRRRFLDRLVLALEPGHANHAARYEAAMRARNKLLTDLPRADPLWLDALETAMGEHGQAISASRADTVAALNRRLADQPEGLFARARLTIESDATNPRADLAADLAAVLRERRSRDAIAGRTLHGPHRDDLAVLHVAKNQPAALCSTGEQKALLMSMILAHADLVAEQRGQRPILLLDEVAAHLDPGRRAALFERLADAGGQVWMTGTEPDLFASAPHALQRFTVEGGRCITS